MDLQNDHAIHVHSRPTVFCGSLLEKIDGVILLVDTEVVIITRRVYMAYYEYYILYCHLYLYCLGISSYDDDLVTRWDWCRESLGGAESTYSFCMVVQKVACRM
jgi:hypothetical protein